MEVTDGWEGGEKTPKCLMIDGYVFLYHSAVEYLFLIGQMVTSY